MNHSSDDNSAVDQQHKALMITTKRSEESPPSGHRQTERDDSPDHQMSSAAVQPKLDSNQKPGNQSWLLRLFESKLFDMNIAITYLYNSKEPGRLDVHGHVDPNLLSTPGVLSYLGNRIFTFPPSGVDFFLPQLIVLYIHNLNIAEAIHPYLVTRCRSSVYTSLHIVWLLNAFCPETQSNSARKGKSLGHKLRHLVLSEELRHSPSKQDRTRQNGPNGRSELKLSCIKPPF